VPIKLAMPGNAGVVIPAAPRSVLDAHPGWRSSVAWSFVADTGVYRLDGPLGEVRFLKVRRREPRAIPLSAEAARLRWARPFIVVPEVIESGVEDGTDWLLTKGLAGRDGTDAALLAEPERLVSALARGLGRFHETLPVASCPFDFRLDVALAHIGRRAAAGLIDPAADFNEEFVHLTVEGAIHELEARRPPTEDLVVCHGDYCFPNALLEDWQVMSYLDIGELGVADRWLDLSVATWSTVWNLGPGYEELFLKAYGIAPDEERIAYYRLLHNLVS
jgi:kanamycin kinase